jgi:ADP-ribose pyrophosphatase YjhB (NUDIX family)
VISVAHERRIRARAICVFRRGDSILVSFAIDPRTGGRYARTLGGAVEFGERAEDALRREIREELGADIVNPRLLGVLENIFTLDGIDRHEIVFVFDAQFADAEWRARTEFAVNEAACIAPATWVPLASLGDHGIPVYPRDLVQLLA